MGYATLPSFRSHDTVLPQTSQNFFIGSVGEESTSDFSAGAHTFQRLHSPIAGRHIESNSRTNPGLRTRHLAREQPHKLGTDIAIKESFPGLRSHIEESSRDGLALPTRVLVRESTVDGFVSNARVGEFRPSRPILRPAEAKMECPTPSPFTLTPPSPRMNDSSSITYMPFPFPVK